MSSIGLGFSRVFPFAAALSLAGLVASPTVGRGETPYRPEAGMARSDVPRLYKWNLAAIWEDADAWEAGRKSLEEALPGILECRGRLAESAQKLRACLDHRYSLEEQLQRLNVYAFAEFSTDRQVSAAQARHDRVQQLATAFGDATAFLEPELLAMERELIQRFLAEEPGLAVYRHVLDDLMRRQAHVLSSEGERVVALSGDLQSGPYGMLNALQQDTAFPMIKDEEGNEVELLFANFPRYRGSRVRSVRQEAVGAFFGRLREHERSFAASLDMAVKRDIFVARARSYDSSLAASLDADNVPVEVFNLVLDTMAANLPRTLHRYVELRRATLGLDELHYYDLYTPLVPSVTREITYEEATGHMQASLAPLGADYLKVLTRGMDLAQGWVDLYPNRGKRSGAYQTDVYGVHPFVFLNYMNELDDAFIAAHEFGHALHSHLANGAQAFVNASPPIFLAEIASTFNEELLLNHLLEQAESPDEKRALLAKRLENIRLTVFRQLMFAEFERDIHAEVEGGGALTAERLSEIYGALIGKYFGPGFTVGDDDAVEWAYIPHFYYNFYVYKYATGLMSAIALVDRVNTGVPGAVEAYLDLLRAGGSDYPLDLLKRAGVELRSPEAMQATFDLFADTMDQFEALLQE